MERGNTPPPPPWRTATAVGLVYLVQGLVAALGVLMLGVLAQLGTPLEDQVGLLASGALPWVLKFALALALDLRPSWRLKTRAIALFAINLGAAASLVALAQLWAAGQDGGPSSVVSVALVWVGLNTLLATQDVLADSLAIDTLGEHRSAAGTLMGLGHALGFGLLGPLLITPRILSQGMAAGLRLPAPGLALAGLAMASVLWLPGRPSRPDEVETPGEADEVETSGGDSPAPPRLGALQVLFALAAFALVMTGANLTQAVSAELLFNELSWDYARFSSLVLPLGAVVGVLGAALAGPAVARWGPGPSAAWAAGGLALSWLVFALARPLWIHEGSIVALAVAEGCLQPALLVALHTLALGLSARARLPTTGFVLAMAALNLPRVIAPLTAPAVLDAGGWIALFGTAALATLAGAWLMVNRRWPLGRLDPPRSSQPTQSRRSPQSSQSS